MKLILCLGRCNNGKFVYFDVFIGLLNWIYNTCNQINVYLKDDKEIIQNLKKLQFRELSLIDRSSAIICYRLTDINKYVFDYLKIIKYNIDNGVQIIHFLKNNIIKVEIQVEDYNNYAVLSITDDEEVELVKYLPNNFNNQNICNNYASDIDYILNGENWRAV
jgi:hypothetical protein